VNTNQFIWFCRQRFPTCSLIPICYVFYPIQMGVYPCKSRRLCAFAAVPAYESCDADLHHLAEAHVLDQGTSSVSLLHYTNWSRLNRTIWVCTYDAGAFVVVSFGTNHLIGNLVAVEYSTFGVGQCGQLHVVEVVLRARLIYLSHTKFFDSLHHDSKRYLIIIKAKSRVVIIFKTKKYYYTIPLY
jgi:hypothetical protein